MWDWTLDSRRVVCRSGNDAAGEERYVIVSEMRNRTWSVVSGFDGVSVADRHRHVRQFDSPAKTSMAGVRYNRNSQE